MASPSEHAERIRRMELAGLITPSQAAQLRDSVQPLDAGDRQRRGRAPLSWLVVFGLSAALVAGIVAVLLVPGAAPPEVQDVADALNQPGAVGNMNPTVSKLIAAALLLIIPLVLWAWLHNSLVAREEKVFEAWAQTESNFQRRADLVPALVETVTRYLKHESETLTQLARERGQASERLAEALDELIKSQREATEILRENPELMIADEAKLARLFASQAAVGRNVGNLFAVVEAYPELRSADQFLELQAQLEGTENRINVARMRFNDAVREFNRTIRQLPWNLVAGAGNFQRKAYFQSAEEAHNAPQLGFD